MRRSLIRHLDKIKRRATRHDRSTSSKLDSISGSKSFWPNGAKAAVSFTYDDGRPSHLDIAQKDLERAGFRGTFFLTAGLFSAHHRLNDWRNAWHAGHEIMNHTVTHSRNYAKAEDFMENEVRICEDWLNSRFCDDASRVFAYPEGVPFLENGQRYDHLLPTTFMAARISDGEISSASSAKLRPHLISSACHTWSDKNAQSSISFLKHATSIADGWAVMSFHNIVEEAHAIPGDLTRSDHLEIIDHVSNNKQDYWVAPFREVFSYIMLQ
jgi:hypothetical protein